MKPSKILLLICSVVITSCAYDLDDNLLSENPNMDTVEIIAADSDLFDNLVGITNDEDRPDQSITCINFIYPLTLFAFDENDEYLYTSGIDDDDQFSSFLETIDENYSISISFPITSTLDSGETFEINTKAELKEAIDSCLSIEMVGECQTIIRECIWKVGYSFIDDNSYLGSLIQENDGFTTLNHEGELYTGSWTPFTIENELHINLNIIDTTAVGNYFNFDWKVEYLDANSLKLKHFDRELILNQRCDPEFADCGNFNFEACETELNSGISEFILNDYTACIFDTLEFDNTNNNYDISYHETEADALLMTNPIVSEEPYSNIENDQIIYVRINDSDTDTQYYVLITLSSVNC
ncbi:hypothetical protein [uncultured Psychroserpens sp.]|uniref:hypothetical protein n=1 Tax=uncultured Psychroserpens sp. TaxID=255436 RepID=UPI0026110D34|nr:hypothetical protein [uncultured Psychroserpens sp.]